MARGKGIGQPATGAGRAHAPQGDVGREPAVLGGEAQRLEGRVDLRGQGARGLGALPDAGPENARPSRRGEGAQPAQGQVEDGDGGSRRRDGGGDGSQPLRLDIAKELQGQVKVAGGDPGDVGPPSAKALGLRRQPLTQLVGEPDGDEGANPV